MRLVAKQLAIRGYIYAALPQHFGFDSGDVRSTVRNFDYTTTSLEKDTDFTMKNDKDDGGLSSR